MKRSAGWVLAAVLALVCAAPYTGAQDVQLMLKWGQAQDIHYDVVGEYSGEVMIMHGHYVGHNAPVTDRFELGFDWNPVESTLIGKPIFKNFPSTLPANTFANSCMQPPPLTGTYEHFDILDAKLHSLADISFTIKRTYPGGSIPYFNEEHVCSLDPSPARTETITSGVGVLIIPGIYFAMPQSAGANVTVMKDGKTIILDDKANGWKYTYTLRIVK